MAIVKVWNDNAHPHKEMYKGGLVEIPAGKYIEMEYEEAVQFRGQFSGVAPIGPDGKPDARYFKKIRVEKPSVPAFVEEKLVNHADGKSYATKEELLAALEAVADRRVVDRDAEKALAGQKSTQQAEIDALKKQVEEMKAMMDQKRGPGRPRKEA